MIYRNALFHFSVCIPIFTIIACDIYTLNFQTNKFLGHQFRTIMRVGLKNPIHAKRTIRIYLKFSPRSLPKGHNWV